MYHKKVGLTKHLQWGLEGLDLATLHRYTQCVATELSARIYLPVHGLFT